MRDRRYLDPAAETLPREELVAYQERRMLDVVRDAYQHSPFYQRLWDDHGVRPGQVRTLADFRARVPFTTKARLRAYRERTGDPFSGLLCVDEADLTSVSSSSGTTGTPMFFAERWRDCPPLPAAGIRDLWEIGLRPGDTVLSQPGTIRNLMDPAHLALGLTIIGVESGPGHMTDVVDAVRRHRPAFLQLTYAQVVELSRLAGEHDLRAAFSGLKAVAFAGMPLSRRMRQMVRDDWGVELFEYTSAADTGTAWECREHNGFHLWEDMVLAECLDPDGTAPVADGDVGELVATDLDNPVAPLIRYRSEDLVRMDRRRCGCGRTHGRMRLVGRRGDEILVRGTRVTLQDIGRAIEEQPESAGGVFQIVRPQREVDVLTVRVGYVPTAGIAVDELRTRLVTAIHAGTGVRPVVELHDEAGLLAASSGVGKVTRVVTS